MKKSLVLLGLLASLNANANLISNGGFEEYPVGPNTAAHISTTGACTNASVTCIGNDAIYDWGPTTAAPAEFLEVRDSFGIYGSAFEGSNFVELNPATNSGIIQTFLADAGSGTLNWYEKGRQGDYQPGNYLYSVFLNNNVIFNGATTSISDWTQKTFNNVALLQGTNTLSFVSNYINADVGAQIDNVSLTQVAAVPEPETYGMMMLGLAMLGFASRRRKQ